MDVEGLARMIQEAAGRGVGEPGSFQTISQSFWKFPEKDLGLLLWHLWGGSGMQPRGHPNAMSAAMSSEGEDEAALRRVKWPRGKMAALLHGQQAGNFRKKSFSLTSAAPVCSQGTKSECAWELQRIV